MATKTSKTTGRPKPLVHTPGLTKTKRRFGCGGKVTKKTKQIDDWDVKSDTNVTCVGITP